MNSIAATCLALALLTTPAAERSTVLIVVGTPGTPEYRVTFDSWVARWRDVASKADADFRVLGPQPAERSAQPPALPGATDHDRLRDFLAERARLSTPGALWLVLIGHGSFDGREAKFNLEGPDCSNTELAGWLKPITSPVAILDCTSSSGPFLSKLSGPNRVVITATKSGQEQNYARFGQFLAEAWTNPQADLDKDGQTSLLEAFLIAGKQTAEFYKTKARLSTEHALIDDNGDGKGTPADWFEGIRLTRKAKEGTAADGLKANQFLLIRHERDRQVSPELIQQRNDLEVRVAALQDQKKSLGDDEFYRQLEALLVPLARTYAEPTDGHSH